MILLIDNYDSFSYNLYQYIGEITPDIKVIRNNEKSIEDIENMNPACIIISPGPGRPKDAGICEDVINYFKGKVPILGICLGHQAICEVFGATITYARRIMHGKTSNVELNPDTELFKNLPPKIKAARYHSLAADINTIPQCLQIIAKTDDNEVMSVKHKDFEIYGLQFHPESILTEGGKTIIKNFLTRVKQ